MCIAQYKKVKMAQGNTALLTDGRTVRLAPSMSVQSGDWVEVYADIALAKVNSDEVQKKKDLQGGNAS